MASGTNQGGRSRGRIYWATQNIIATLLQLPLPENAAGTDEQFGVLLHKRPAPTSDASP